MYYEPARDVVAVVPVFVAEVSWTDPVHLSDEHDRYAYASPAVTARKMLWDSQRLALAAVRTEVLASGRKSAAREVTARIANPAPRPRRRAGA